MSVASSSIPTTEPILTKCALDLYFGSTHMREILFLEVLKVNPTHILAKKNRKYICKTALNVLIKFSSRIIHAVLFVFVYSSLPEMCPFYYVI